MSGTELISVGSTSHTVSMGTTLSGIDYQVDVELVSSDTSPCVYGYVIGNKTNSGFTVYFSGEIDTSNYSLDWIVRA